MLRILKSKWGVVDSNCQTSKPPVTEPPKTIQLNLGVMDSNRYGRNYGTNEHIDTLQAEFTALPDRNHVISWRAYDIERNQVTVFLNGKQIRTVATTYNNQLGSTETITIPSKDIVQGTNKILFKVNGGDDVWGVTNLKVVAKNLVGDGEPQTLVLLDSPDRLWSSSYGFEFESRGSNYKETVIISFNSLVKMGGINGFNVYLNGKRILKINSYLGNGVHPFHQIVLNKSQVKEGLNILKIESFVGPGGSASDALHYNVKVITKSVPLLDVSVGELKISDEIKINSNFSATASVLNVAAKSSKAASLTFYTSINSDRTNSRVLGVVNVASMVGGSSIDVSKELNSRGIKKGEYFWACVSPESGDINIVNNCSESILIDLKSPNLAPLIMLLLDDQ